MAIAAMGERYGDRLVNSLERAGQTIENGLKAVTTMKELNSLGQQMSQLSPESPDYQQQLIGLGAAHPFALHTPEGQHMLQMGNESHLKWQHQQYAMEAADREDARAKRHDSMAYRTAVAVARMKGKQDAVKVPFNTGEGQFNESSAMPQAGFSGSAAMNNTTGQPGVVLDAKLGDAIPEEEPGYEAPPPPPETTTPKAGFSGSAAESNSSNASPNQPSNLGASYAQNLKRAATPYMDNNGKVDPKMIPHITSNAVSLTNAEASRIGQEDRQQKGFEYGNEKTDKQIRAKEDYLQMQSDLSSGRAQDASARALSNAFAIIDKKIESAKKPDDKFDLMQQKQEASALYKELNESRKAYAGYKRVYEGIKDTTKYFMGEKIRAAKEDYDSSKYDVDAAELAIGNFVKKHNSVDAESNSTKRNKVFNPATGKVE